MRLPEFSNKRYMKVTRLSALSAARLYPPRRSMVLISVRGWVDPRATVQLEGLSHWKSESPHRELNPRPSGLRCSAASNYATAYRNRHVKGKGFPLQAWAGPWESGRLRLRIFSTFGTMKVVRSSPLRTGRLYPQEFSWYSFLRLSRPQDTWFRR
jgi:hypothetical protein